MSCPLPQVDLLQVFVSALLAVLAQLSQKYILYCLIHALLKLRHRLKLMFSYLYKQEDVSVQLEALDILGDLLSRFGGKLQF